MTGAGTRCHPARVVERGLRRAPSRTEERRWRRPRGHPTGPGRAARNRSPSSRRRPSASIVTIVLLGSGSDLRFRRGRTTPSVTDIVEQAIVAQGGLDLWESAGEVSVQMSSGGFAFASKSQGRALRDVQARISTRGQHVTLAPYPRPGQRGVLEQDGTVRIETDGGELVEARGNARGAFRDLRHKLWWDRLDMLYFGGYAIWTYVSTPFVFAREDYRVVEL